MVSLQKLCDSTMLSNVIVWLFLLVLVGLCIGGIAGDNKYSCDNGYFSPNDIMTDKKCVQAMATCVNKTPGSDTNKCMVDNGCGECVEGHLSRIILIVILCLVGVYLLYKVGCTMSKNKVSQLTEGVPLVGQ